jgi:hypothetical protein
MDLMTQTPDFIASTGICCASLVASSRNHDETSFIPVNMNHQWMKVWMRSAASPARTIMSEPLDQVLLPNLQGWQLRLVLLYSSH